MREISMNDVIMFLVKNMASTKVETNERGTEVVFSNAADGNVMCELYIAYRDDIKVVNDALEYLCTHPKLFQEVKNGIVNYYIKREAITLHADFTTLGERLCFLSNRAEDIQKDLIKEYSRSVKNEEPHNPNIDYIEFILTKLTRRDILEQLAEEASELADVGNYISDHANDLTKFAIKLIRATEDTNNVTPYSVEGINDKLKTNVHLIHINRTERLEEECGDANMCLDLLHHIDDGEPIEKFHTLDNPKWKRWAERLGFISF